MDEMTLASITKGVQVRCPVESMNVMIYKLFTCSLACFFFNSVCCEEKRPEVELTHWWNQPGELEALGVIREAVEQRGAKFVETRIASWSKLRSTIINRISSGYAPAATQWLVDDDIFGLREIGAVQPLPSVFRGQAIKDVLLPGVYEEVTSNGELLSLPLGIHIQNAALFNTEIYTKLKLPFPVTWKQVLDQAPAIKREGYIPIAVSNELWQFCMLFNTILIERLGFKNYLKLYTKKQSIKPWREALVDSFRIFLKLKQFSDPQQKNRDWAQAVRMVGDKKAAMNIMGDFAKAELSAKGLVAGKDFFCSLAPGSNGNIVYAIDSFMMLNTDEPYLKKGQSILFDVALDPDIQAAYNSRKGSMPIRRGVDLSKLDACTRKSYQLWLHPDTRTIRFSGVSNPLRTSFFEAVLKRAWYDDNLSAEQLADELIGIDESALKHSHTKK